MMTRSSIKPEQQIATFSQGAHLPEVIQLAKPSRISPVQQLQEYEAVIRRGWETFLEVGEALARIRDKGLYKLNYSSFKTYCRDRWQFGKSHAYHLIGAAQVVKELSTIVDGPLPANEAQVRPLVGLQPDIAKLAWTEALKDAKAGKVTASLIKQKVTDLTGKNSRSKKRHRSRNQSAPSAKLHELLDQIESAVKNQEKTTALRLIQEAKGLADGMD